MNRIFFGMFAVLALIFTGCQKPYHEEVLVDIKTSEVAIMVETVNDNGQAAIAPKNKGEDGENSNFYADRLVNARKVKIPYYLKQTGRSWFWLDMTNCAWKPAARLIVVDTAPTSMKWANDGSNAIWVESSDSVAFSTGISVTCRIEDQQAAIQFLSNYPPENYRNVATNNGEDFKVEVSSLHQIMNEELYNEIQDTYSYVSAGYIMDDLRDKKQFIIDIVKNGGTIQVVDPAAPVREDGKPVYKTVTIDGVISTFAERGVKITSLGQFGGFKYENPKIQDSIDKVFQAQQDEEVAIAESRAAEKRKKALKLKGEGEAARVLEARRGEAEGIKLVADAKAYEVEQLNKDREGYLALRRLEIARIQAERWDGVKPKFLMGEDSDANLLLSIPQLSSL